MSYNPEIHHRKSMRLKKYDYSISGSYFITICVADRINCLAMFMRDNFMEEDLILSDLGCLVKEQWLAIPNRYSNVKLDEFIIMPNHFHGIITVNNGLSENQKLDVIEQGRPQGRAPTL